MRDINLMLVQAVREKIWTLNSVSWFTPDGWPGLSPGPFGPIDLVLWWPARRRRGGV